MANSSSSQVFANDQLLQVITPTVVWVCARVDRLPSLPQQAVLGCFKLFKRTACINPSDCA